MSPHATTNTSASVAMPRSWKMARPADEAICVQAQAGSVQEAPATVTCLWPLASAVSSHATTNTSASVGMLRSWKMARPAGEAICGAGPSGVSAGGSSNSDLWPLASMLSPHATTPTSASVGMLCSLKAAQGACEASCTAGPGEASQRDTPQDIGDSLVWHALGTALQRLPTRQAHGFQKLFKQPRPTAQHCSYPPVRSDRPM